MARPIPVTFTPPLTERITIALAEVRQARRNCDYAREFRWIALMDRLIDQYAAGDR